MNSAVIWTVILQILVVAAENDYSFSWNQIVDVYDDPKLRHHSEIKSTETPEIADAPFYSLVSFLQPIISAFQWQVSQPNLRASINDTNLPLHVRVKRAKRRKMIVRCCGGASCTDMSSANTERVSQNRRKKQDEAEFVNELQYTKRKKKRKKLGADLSNLQAFGVFTEQGIQISCAGCPAGWPDMLTVYPEYEIGIPVSCSNCPNNWPGALNLLGLGGDASWQSPAGRVRGGNNFNAFDAASNFGSNFPPPDLGGGADRAPIEEDYDGGAESTPARRRSKKKGSTAAPDDEEEKKSTDEQEIRNAPPNDKVAEDENDEKDEPSSPPPSSTTVGVPETTVEITTTEKEKTTVAALGGLEELLKAFG